MQYFQYVGTWIRAYWVMMGGVIFLVVFGLQTIPTRAATSDHDRVSCLRIDGALDSIQNRLAAGPRPEPAEDFMVSEDVNIVTGLYTRAYSLRQNGVVDYKTARQIIFSEYNEYWNTVVHAKAFPLLYWEDHDQDGQFDMWVDQQGDGAPCDIVPYQFTRVDRQYSID